MKKREKKERSAGRRGSLAARLVDLWYGLRVRRGLPSVSRARIKRLAEVYPERVPEEEARRQDEIRMRRIVRVLAATVVLAAAAAIFSGASTVVTSLERPASGTQVVSLKANYGGEVTDVEITVSERAYTEEEVEELLDAAEEAMCLQVLGENPSAQEVSLSLDLSSDCPVEDVTASWSPADSDLISWDGSISEEADLSGGVETVLILTLTCEGTERRVEFPVLLVEAEEAALSADEVLAAALEEAEAEDPTADQVVLPSEVDGTAVSYEQEEEGISWLMVVLLGFLAAAAVFSLTDQRLKEAEERRNQELLLSYSELTAKLMVLTEAGLTVRGAWERMTADYQRQRARGGKRRILYEEMAVSVRALSQGRTEEQIYGEFGRRCGLAPYLRLGGLLESHVKNGSKGFGAVLQAEASDAFEERLQLARRQGEEISAKLLLPLMLLFALVLALLVIPAFMSL